MAKKINKKKIVGICPVEMKKTACPSIKRTRQIRTKLLMLQREDIVNTKEKAAKINEVKKLRAALKEKKNKGIAVDCAACRFNVEIVAAD